MKPKVYVETTIPSYLTADRSLDPLVASRQHLTKEWWRAHRHRFALFVSESVLKEASSGNSIRAARRLASIKGIPELVATAEAKHLSSQFLVFGALSDRSLEDAIHIAIATVHEMDYLVTWNCRHIANAAIIKRFAEIAAKRGYRLPLLCTPAQLMGN